MKDPQRLSKYEQMRLEVLLYARKITTSNINAMIFDIEIDKLRRKENERKKYETRTG